MQKYRVEYSTSSKAIPPRPIRVATSGWAGLPQKMVDGSQPQPWHCLPFVEGSTHGLELLYPYDTPCQVLNDNGAIRFDWDFAKEPGAELTGGEFMAFAPRDAPRFYMFNTRIDIEPPPGHVLRTEPHPRFFTDDTGTVPLCMIGHLQNEWWPRRLFVVFRAPLPGQRHIFRKDEPYAQVLIVPQRVSYELAAMSGEKDAQRRELERKINALQHHIADNLWQNPTGAAFSNYYKVLGNAFAREGLAGVERVVEEASVRQGQSLPDQKTIPQCLDLAHQSIAAKRFNQAGEIYHHILSRDPDNAQAVRGLSIVMRLLGSPGRAIELMARAAALEPASPEVHGDLGEMLRLAGRYPEAEAAFRRSLELDPHNPGLLSALGLTLARQGRFDDGLRACHDALAMGWAAEGPHLRMGMIFALQGKYAQARASYQAALAANPAYAQAQSALRDLPS
jgi:Flp pilus assembly protein TadD